MKALLKNLKLQKLESMIEKKRIDAIVRQEVICIELPVDFMQLKNCEYVETISSCRYYKNAFKQTKIILPKTDGYLCFQPDGSVIVEIIKKHDLKAIKSNNKTLPYYKTDLYNVVF